MEIVSYLAFALMIVLSAPLPFALSWTPPVGTPMPSFGIFDAPPTVFGGWVAPVHGFYYVDQTSTVADDFANPYGWPGKPRRTIPVNLPAGSVVELHGTYSFAHTSPRGIVSAGTASAPVFIRGTSAAARPRITSCWEMSGSYYVVENVEFSDCGSVVFLAPTDHAALRHSEVHGNLSGGGVGVQSWNGGTVTDVVIQDDLIHDNGDVHASYDQDVHGIAVGAHVSNLWVVDNKLYRNSGDGIQINAGSAALQSTTHHIYVGRNTSFENKQSGFWVKQAVDVIFSENLSARHRPGNSSSGVCMGGQYAPEHVWFIDNQMWDCDYGIQIASDNDEGTGQYQFVIGNIFARIHDSIGTFNPDSAWQNCAISLPGGTYKFVVENSITAADSGVCIPYKATQIVYLYDNAIDGVAANGYHLFVEGADQASGSANLFSPNYRLRGGQTAVVLPAGSYGGNDVVDSIGWVDPGSGDFKLTATSRAVNRGMMNMLGVWEYFEKRYGQSIRTDVYGTRRPAGSAPDVGATERP